MASPSIQNATVAAVAALPPPVVTQDGMVMQSGSSAIARVVEQRLASSHEQVREARRNFWFDLGLNAVVSGCVGTAIGLAAGLSGAALPIAALVGAWYAIDHRCLKNRGEVSIELDGTTRRTSYYWRPQQYEKTAAELTAELMASGVVGDVIPVPTAVLPVTGPTKAALLPHAETLTRLAQERRILADFGQVARNGEPVLQLITASVAADLLAAGRPIQIVTASKVSDVPRTLRISASNKERSQALEERYHWLERRCECTLQTIAAPVELAASFGSVAGLPAGFLGLYRDQRAYSMVIARSAGEGLGVFEAGATRLEHRAEQVSHDQSVRLGGETAHVDRVSILDLRRLLALVGAGGLGGATMALGASMPLARAALVIGAIVGKKAGDILNRRQLVTLRDREDEHYRQWQKRLESEFGINI